MNTLKLEKVEDILTLQDYTVNVSIPRKEVVIFLYYNQKGFFNKKKNIHNCYEINVDEVKSLYTKSLDRWYKNREYLNEITFTSSDIGRICLGIK
ncbi:hypothetical protein [Lacrimispora amygdalina]|uniref:hypothetical protein n=1 Tax=Lacrimispora amygdalina TaxID=253257 RepID=UPI000BE3FFDB|nr:hypothetical protein [Lacrimispora amygdalina]